MPVSDLEGLLAPLSVETFLTEAYGRAPRVARGDPARFRGLLPWTRLNALVRERHLDWFRAADEGIIAADAITLSRDGHIRHSPAVGRTVPGEYSIDRDRSPQLDPVRLNHELRAGATLLVRHLDKVHEPLALLAEAVERVLEEPVMVRAFATWTPMPGFGPHCDRYDTLVMQLEGTKRWRLFGPDPAVPLMGDGDHSAIGDRPPDEELLLEPGDLLYVPQGWWHEVATVEAPCLHLTADIYQRSGVDLVEWITRQLARHPEFRDDLPPESDPEARAAHLERLAELALEDWTGDVVDRFLTDSRIHARPQRATMSLPRSATRGVLEVGAGLRIRMLNPRPLHRTDPVETDGTVEIRTQGQRIRLTPDRAALLEPVLAGEVADVDELVERDPTVRDTLVDWVLAGHLSILEP